jgi:ATP-binding cassette subfamily B protein
MVISSIAEVISLGAVIPFLGILTNPEVVFAYEVIQPFIQLMGYKNPSDLIIPLTIIFVISATLAGIIRLSLLYLLTRISFAIGSDMSVECYKRTLFQDYSVHLNRNSSEVINIIVNQVDVVIKSVITPALILISSIIIMLGIVAALFFINSLITGVSFIFFGLVYLFIIKISKVRLNYNSEILAQNSIRMTRLLQEGIGGVRDIILRSSQGFYSEIYKKVDQPFRRAAGNNIFIANSPRPAVEAIGIVFIAIMASLVIQDSSANVAVLGALALGCQRLLPVMQQSYSSYSSIMGSKDSFYKLIDLLSQEYQIKNKLDENLKFEKYIELRNIGFRYSTSGPWILRNIDIKIPTGASVGFVGSTGGGKSTLADLIMGLLVPTEGEILIDGIALNDENRAAWRSFISHVPQTIFLTDSTVAENIAFTNSELADDARIKEAASLACIHETILKMSSGYTTYVGEQGIKLSGGQKQRLGIARALYVSSKLIILDEATSSLDGKTEKIVMDGINKAKANLTKIIIAHRISTLQDCDMIFEISDSGVFMREFDQLV